MSQNLGILNDVATNTTLNNILELLENRLKALDYESETLVSSEYNLKNALSTAIRACSDIPSSNEVILAIQQLQIFYMKYSDVMDEFIVQRLEKRFILYLKNKLVKAGVKTMQTYDKLSIGLFQRTLEERGIIKTSYSIDGNAINKLKQFFKGGKKDGTTSGI